MQPNDIVYLIFLADFFLSPDGSENPFLRLSILFWN